MEIEHFDKLCHYDKRNSQTLAFTSIGREYHSMIYRDNKLCLKKVYMVSLEEKMKIISSCQLSVDSLSLLVHLSWSISQLPLLLKFLLLPPVLPGHLFGLVQAHDALRIWIRQLLLLLLLQLGHD